ncbi:MAG: glycosyltransferase [Candidatus Aenigmatarchaeota archaeon]
MKEKLSIIIPACNEQDNIKRIPSELMPVARKIGNFEVIIVDDGSKDLTAKIAKELSKDRRIRLVKHEKNMGLGAAIRTGIANSTGDLIVFLDADFTFHPSEIPKLLEKYNKGNYDCVIGTQFGKGGKTKMQFHRKILSKGVNTLYRIFLGRKITSMSSIFRLYKKSALRGIGMKSNNFDICAEMLFDMIKNGKSITEVPVTLTTRMYGESKLNNRREIKNHIKVLTKILKWRLFG